jgi:hypothetical protein
VPAEQHPATAKVIIAALTGGLGNQLFQYAAARRLAKHKGVEFALDTSDFDRRGRRRYGLERFAPRVRLATPQETLRVQDRQNQDLWHRAWRQRRKLLPYYRRRVILEQHPFQFDPHLLELPAEAYLIGYWQNEKYFAPLADALRAELTLKTPLSTPSAVLAEELRANNAVGVHVRRGDYVSNAAVHQRFGVCSPEYYRDCARQLLAQHPQAVFYVFSDDPEWARNNLDLGRTPIIVDHNGPERDYEDLYLLSLCHHFIIANSSFSWWAAWLSTWPEKIVYGPRRWQASGEFDTSDILPAGWRAV